MAARTLTFLCPKSGRLSGDEEDLSGEQVDPVLRFPVGSLRVKLSNTRLASHTCRASLSLIVSLDPDGAVTG